MTETVDEEAYVSFSISAPDLDPDEVSALLSGITPTHTHRQGDRPKKSLRSKAAPSPYKHGMWLIQSGLPPGKPLVEHLEQLLSLLEERRTEIKALSTRASVGFGCDLWGPPGLELPADLLARMGSLGADFSVTVYPDYDEDGVPNEP